MHAILVASNAQLMTFTSLYWDSFFVHIFSASLYMSTDVFSIIFGNGIRSGCLNHYGKVDNACAVVHRLCFFVGIIYILQLQCVLFQPFLSILS